MNAFCPKCRVNCGLKKPLRKSSFELNVIHLLTNKLKDQTILIDNRIRLEGRVIFPDIIIGQNIIEVQGDYWHCNPSKFQSDFYHKAIHKTAEEIWAYDKVKKDELIKRGYNVLYVWGGRFLFKQRRNH